MLRIENLCKTYADGTRALKGISFEITRGEFVAVLGQSGSGKSTLLRCLNRLVEPTRGRIYFDDADVTAASAKELRSLRRRMGMIFQQYNLVNRASVLTNALTGSLGAVPSWAGLVNHFPKQAAARAERHLAELGIADKAAQRASALSGGQQQRVGIARALMQEPELILADEPVSSLDPATARTILDILKDINQNRRVSVICNLHLPELAKEYGSRILALAAGKLVYDGTPEGLDESVLDRIYNGE